MVSASFFLSFFFGKPNPDALHCSQSSWFKIYTNFCQHYSEAMAAYHEALKRSDVNTWINVFNLFFLLLSMEFLIAFLFLEHI